MTIGFQNLVMLFGLGAVAIPVLIHLLHRRRYEVVDWGATQFLQIGETTRRRLHLEEILLLLLRMAGVAMLVLSLAGPYSSGDILAGVGGRPGRDIVLIFDGSYSMGYDAGDGKTPHANAQDWATSFVSALASGDRAALLRSGKNGATTIAEPTHDLDLLRDKISALPSPKGNADWPRALEDALRITGLADKQRNLEIICLTDGRRFGWADGDTLSKWEAAAERISSPGDDAGPSIHVMDMGQNLIQLGYTNFALAPIRPSRPIAWTGEPLTFHSALILNGFEEYRRPHRIRLDVDGQGAADIPAPAGVSLGNGQVPLLFSHRFDRPGKHVITAVLEPNLPTDKRSGNSRPLDCLPGDNRQEVRIEIVDSLAVLVVDGADRLASESSTYFMIRALSSAVKATTVPAKDFDPRQLTEHRPRVLILADVPRLTGEQQQAVTGYVEEGGSLLIVLGGRVEASFYNASLYQEGRGLLPARLVQFAGDPANEQAAGPDMRRLQHPVFRVFRDAKDAAFAQARFPRWWKVAPAETTTSSLGGAFLVNGDPLLLEKQVKDGRVLLCTVPLDRSGGGNLPSLWEFPVLMHELIFYLAAAKTADNSGFDLRESDLTPLSAADKKRVADLLPMQYLDGAAPPAQIFASSAPLQQLWWLLMTGVILFLCAELWLTRRMAAGRT